MCLYCGFCKHAINKREWTDKLYYGDGRYDIVYREEIICEIDNSMYHPMEFGCNGEYFERG